MAMYKVCPYCSSKYEYNSKCSNGCQDKATKQKYKDYARYREDKDMQRFYASKVWIKLSELVKKHFMGLCVVCWIKGIVTACTTTHHIIETKDRDDLMLVEDNLISLCSSCHSKVHKAYDKSAKDKEQMQQALRDARDKFNQEYGL